MSTRKPKKVRKMRGSRMHGYGRIGQHRKAGQRGGKGKTGGKKHDWTYVTAHDPDRFGKHGFQRYTKLRQDHTTINVGEIARSLPRFTEGKPAAKGEPISIDLTTHGYDKVLGAGSITVPVAVTAPIFTHRAAEKIKAAGGKIKGSVQEPTKHPAPSLTQPPKPAPKPTPKAKVEPKTKPKKAAKPKKIAKSKKATKSKTTTKSTPKAASTKAKPKRAVVTKGKAKT
ncbi:MAG: uL15 family ribosomal protein [Promethearchaeota archaeon]